MLHLVVRDTGRMRWDDADGYTAVSTLRVVMNAPPVSPRSLGWVSQPGWFDVPLKKDRFEPYKISGTRCRGTLPPATRSYRGFPKLGITGWKPLVGSYRVREVSR